jgi:hypothetical protein
MDTGFKLGDQVELVHAMEAKTGDLWAIGSKGLVIGVGDEVSVQMNDARTYANALIVAPMAVMLRAFRRLSEFN